MNKYIIMFMSIAVGLIVFVGYMHLSKQQNSGGLNDSPSSLVIIYTDAGFNPNPATGDEPLFITFKNNSSKSFQPVNDNALNPENGPCSGAENGACAPIPPGGSWSAEFVADTWHYHNKLDPSQKIVIEVKSLRYPIK